MMRFLPGLMEGPFHVDFTFLEIDNITTAIN